MKKRILSPNTIIPAHLYVERAADRQLKTVIDEMGRPAYILVARQMGKTNLLLNMKRHRKDDLVVYFDLSNRFESARSFFRNIIDTIIESASEEFKAVDTINAHRQNNALEPSVEYDRHLRLLLNECEKKIILILDEIDSLIGCSYSDTILSQVRSMYFSRGNFDIYRNLTYVLSGVAEPVDLIKDKNISPFNIGEKIYLEDFTNSEFNTFVSNAELPFSSEITERIFWWADGNPRISWDICSEIELEALKGGEISCETVDTTVDRLYLREYDRAPIDHIRTLVEFDSEIRKAIMSIRYSRSDFADDKIKGKLYLAGIAKTDGDKGVVIKNRVIDSALSERWIQQLDNSKFSAVDEAAKAFISQDFEKVIRIYSEIGTTSVLTETQLLEFGEAHLNSENFNDAQRQFDIVAERTSDPRTRQLSTLLSGISSLLLKNYHFSLNKFVVATEGPDRALSVTARLNLQVIYGRLAEAKYRSDAISMSLALIEEVETLNELDQHYLSTTALANLAVIYLAYGDELKWYETLSKALAIAPIEFQPFLLVELYKRSPSTEEKNAALDKFVNLVAANDVELSNDLRDVLGLSKAVLGQALLGLVEQQQLPVFEQLLSIVKRRYFESYTSAVAILVDLAEAIDEIDHHKAVQLLQHSEAYCLTDETPAIDRIRLYRQLANSNNVEVSRGWGLAFLSQLNMYCPVEMLGEADVEAALSIISGGMHHKRHEIMEYFRLFRKFETTTNSRWPEAGVIFVYIQLQHALSLRNEAEAVTQANSILELMKSIDRTKIIREIYEPLTKAAMDTIRKSRRKEFKNYNRNEKLLVQYGTNDPVIVKFKLAEEDLYFSRCTLIGRA
ncbi:AAA-like domain-containing protein [Pseudomonas sp. 21LCFQ02]|uniref:AAA-like domain-containing protein n=1 Tax=Pseudomonas sp. 21LCFQ02 TaxID=2957505 RepID=UPI00209AB18D|nr:AAA-like domain-containing protein [Pseudomonas sp. 21LCFQ02]MCO8166195.1 AAA-like domain-containing protein [Pseudomonas sp. 21LCFQ02]